MRRWAVALLGVAVLLLGGCGKAERAAEYRDKAALHQERHRLHLVSSTVVETLAREDYAAQVRAADKAGRLDVDPESMELLDRVAGPIVAQARKMYPGARDWEWEIHLVTTPEINAVCYPGGKILVFSGLLDATGHDPHKLAMVLGHEVSHALLEHGRAALSRNWALYSGMWIVGKSFKMGAVRSDLILSQLNLTLRPMDRTQESEADVLGLELMARAGFDPVAGARLWEDFIRVKGASSESRKRLEAFTSDHPPDEERLHTLSRLARQAEVRQQGGAR